MIVEPQPPLSPSTARGVVLVVDDQMQNIQVVGTVLTREGYEVIPATSGAQALQRIAARLPDLVLLDVVMPDVDGFTVCKRLREHPDTAGLPVIFVSAANDSETIVRGLEAGGVDYITKPFNKAELLARVRTQVDLQRARETTSRMLRERENIVSMVAHDLKNPLGAIRFSAQTLLELPAEKINTASDLTGHIVATCDQMLKFIDRFLNNRAQEAEHERMTTVHISSEQIKEMLTAWYPNAKRKNTTLAVTLSETPLLASGDLFTVRQIVDNLMSNAVKFSPLGSQITSRVYADGERFIIDIEDEGPGFSESDLARIFQDYTRLSARPTGGESSTGLGLAIAKRGADRMGAKLTIDNRSNGQGSIARLALPLALVAKA
ncbi:hybrid sensor histidine kinase/response regulator [Prosthecobacter dejongeii]|uniref:histidine kinase n=1 Tax=Prosthecobacter dejongeii TaxID=48465 RepID=A0A7W7YPQ6_9BACT|nr:hybrid sensor histidine kinase/response regulator [Prosthecobacter dejongeii]MBB5039912.1 two-component system sensor histidine kinase/response regulator [Prosthecobacter dejongeii]